MKIAHKLILGLLVIVSMIGIIGYSTIVASQNKLEQTIIHNSLVMTDELMHEIEQQIYFRIQAIEDYVRTDAIQDTLVYSNLDFLKIPDPEKHIKDMDQKWRSAGSDVVTEFMQSLINNDTAWDLREMMAAYDQKYGYAVFGEIFLTNSLGANIAQTGKTTDYYQADEQWWQKAYQDGIYIDDIEYDESANIFSLGIAVAIKDSDGQFLGILNAELNVDEILKAVKEHTLGRQDLHGIEAFWLTNKDEKMIYSTRPFVFFEENPVKLGNDNRRGVVSRHLLVKENTRKDSKLYTHATSKGYKSFKSQGWNLNIEFTTGTIFNPVIQLRNSILAMIIALLAVGSLFGLGLASSISYPIQQLENSAVRISRGELPDEIKIKSGGEIQLLVQAFNRMVVDLKAQREKLIERSLMDSLVESIKEGIIMLDNDGDIVVINPRARQMLGISSNEPNLYEVVHKKMKMVELDQSLEKSRAKNALIQKEIVIPDQEKLIILCNICPVEAKGKVVGSALIFRDITLEKEVDTTKTEFISTVSHELRTPLAITKEGLSLILDKIAGDITEKQEAILTTAQDNISRLSRLINNLLDISKIEAGKMEIRNTKVDIVSLTKAVISDFKLKAQEKKLDLRMNYPSEEMNIFADRDKVIQVLTNLVNNALKFTIEGHIEISAKEAGEFIEFTVADTGIGISQADMRDTFGKFQQFGRTSGQGEKGTGLGLSIAKGIVEMHGGKIWVESEVNVGTKFKFTLRKFSDDLPLHEFIQTRLVEAQKSAEHLSLVMVDIEKINGGQDLSADQQQQHLKVIENLLNADLHRDGDAIFRDESRCAALISDCDKGHINIVCERIKGTMSRFVDQEKLKGKMDLKVSYATYPDDARNSIDLLKNVKSA